MPQPQKSAIIKDQDPDVYEDRTTELSRSIVYFVAPRGGNNYFARVINGCDKVSTPNIKTCRVSVTPNGRWILEYDDEWILKKSIAMRKLVLVHEAGHLIQRHIERYFKLLSTVTDEQVRVALEAVYNIAMDLADNDTIVRHEKEFEECVKSGEFDGLLPENLKLPRGKSFEEYTALVISQAKQIGEALQQMAERKGQGKGQGQSKSGQGKGEPNAKSKGGAGGQSDEEYDEGDELEDGSSMKGPDQEEDLPAGLAEAAKKNPKLFNQILQNFHKITNDTHKHWNEIGRALTAEEAISLTNKLKNHARQLVRSAHEQTIRARGFVPGYAKGLIDALLAAEQIPWTWLFRDEIQGKISSKVVEAMATPNVSLINEMSMEPWPGYMLEQEFNVIWFTDTSGSMCDKEYARACTEMNHLLNINKNIRVRIIQCDAMIQHEEEVDNIQPPDTGAEAKKRYGYGGTVYTPGFKRILGVDERHDWAPDAWESKCQDPPPKADLLVVYTDGGVVIEGEVFPQYHPGCPILWLLAPNCHPVPGMSNAPPDRVIEMYDMGE